MAHTRHLDAFFPGISNGQGDQARLQFGLGDLEVADLLQLVMMSDNEVNDLPFVLTGNLRAVGSSSPSTLHQNRPRVVSGWVRLAPIIPLEGLTVGGDQMFAIGNGSGSTRVVVIHLYWSVRKVTLLEKRRILEATTRQ